MATTFTFAANSTTHVTTLIVDGSVGDLSVLNSSVAGTQWNIIYDGTPYFSIEYTAIQDSVATPDTIIETGLGCVDLGNNSGWFNNRTRGLYFAAGSTQHITGLSINGTSSDIFEFGSDTPGSSFDLINDSVYPIGAHYCRIFDCHASDDALFEADDTCINGGGTTGWFPAYSRQLQFTAGSTTHCTTFSVNGTSGDLVILKSSSPGSAWYLIADGGILPENTYLQIQDSQASPDSSWKAGTGSDNQGNNTGWFDSYQRQIQFKGGSITHVSSFSVNGVLGDLIILDSDDGTAHYLINDTLTEIICNYLQISHSHATVVDLWKALTSIDVIDNVGWFETGYPKIIFFLRK